MTTQTLVNQVKRLFATSQSDAVIVSFLNEAQRDLARDLSIQATDTTQTTVAGTDTYNAPADLLRFERVLLAGKDVPYVDYESLQFRKDNGVSSPRVWTYRDGKIIFYPAPSSTGDTITQHYWKRVPDLSETDLNQSSPLPVEAQDLMVLFAISRVADADLQYDVGAQKMREYEARRGDVIRQIRRLHRPVMTMKLVR